jgi:hypothetical protein
MQRALARQTTNPHPRRGQEGFLGKSAEGRPWLAAGGTCTSPHPRRRADNVTIYMLNGTALRIIYNIHYGGTMDPWKANVPFPATLPWHLAGKV